MRGVNRRGVTTVALAMALAGCSAADDSAGEPAPEASASGAADAGVAEESSLTLAETAWLVVGQDGAVYTTFLDRDGTYRDFRNGEAVHSGTWERRSDGQICFTPGEEGYSGECWNPDQPGKDGTLRIHGEGERTVELKRIAYAAPGDGNGDDSGDRADR